MLNSTQKQHKQNNTKQKHNYPSILFSFPFVFQIAKQSSYSWAKTNRGYPHVYAFHQGMLSPYHLPSNETI